jgi:hypothetical protein
MFSLIHNICVAAKARCSITGLYPRLGIDPSAQNSAQISASARSGRSSTGSRAPQPLMGIRHLPPAVTQETMLTPGKFGTADVIRNRLAYWICRARRPDRGFHITLNSVFRFERSRRRALSWRARAAPAERSRQRLVDAIGPRSFTRTTTDVPQWLTRSWSRSEESDRRR